MDPAHSSPAPPTELADGAVVRSVEVEAAPDLVWELLVDDHERAAWFGGPTTLEPVPGGDGTFTDPDGTRRVAVVEEVAPGRRLSWTWDSGEDDGSSRVDIDLVPVAPSRPGGPSTGTRVTVTETPLRPSTVAARACVTELRCGIDLRGLELQAMLRTASAIPHCVAG